MPTALRWYFYPGDERRAGDGPLPHKVDLVRSGCIAGQLAHHPEDLCYALQKTGSLQTIVAAPKFRGHPRFSRVAVVQAEGDEVWRAELRILFKAHSPASGQQQQLALVKYFV